MILSLVLAYGVYQCVHGFRFYRELGLQFTPSSVTAVSVQLSNDTLSWTDVPCPGGQTCVFDTSSLARSRQGGHELVSPPTNCEVCQDSAAGVLPTPSYRFPVVRVRTENNDYSLHSKSDLAKSRPESISYSHISHSKSSRGKSSRNFDCFTLPISVALRMGPV